MAICSYTTVVGYGSLLLSQNLGIRSFGPAAMPGEVTCLAVALILAPALLWTTAPELARRQSEAVELGPGGCRHWLRYPHWQDVHFNPVPQSASFSHISPEILLM